MFEASFIQTSLGWKNRSSQRIWVIGQNGTTQALSMEYFLGCRYIVFKSYALHIFVCFCTHVKMAFRFMFLLGK